MTRYNRNDLLAKDKIEVSTHLLYNKKYRDLSNDALVMYMYMEKRFSVSEDSLKKAIEEDEDCIYIDEEGDLFCLVSNDELRFVLSLSEKSIVKAKKELHNVGLLEEVKQSVHKTNRLYINRVEMEIGAAKKFQEEIKEYRRIESEKRKAKNSKRPKQGRVTAIEKVAEVVPVAEEKKPSSPTLPIEPQNLQFNEPQNLQFMNCKNYRLSTKEGFSTKESSSTKEFKVSQSSLGSSIEDDLIDLMENYGFPSLIAVKIKNNSKRLTDNNISVYDIYAFYKSSDNTLDDDDFLLMIIKMLKAESPIGNVIGLLKTAVTNHYLESDSLPNYGGAEEYATFDDILDEVHSRIGHKL